MTVGELKKLLSVMPDDEEVQLTVIVWDEPYPASLRAVTKWPCVVELKGDFGLDVEEEKREEEERKRNES